MSALFICSVCWKRMAGSPLINPIDPGQVGALVTVHMVDEHWELLERIRATTGDNEARLALNRQLVKEALSK